MGKLFNWLFSLLKRLGSKGRDHWSREQAESWLARSGFDLYDSRRSIWAREDRLGDESVIFSMMITSDGSFIGTVSVFRKGKGTTWRSREQFDPFPSPLESIRESLPFMRVKSKDGKLKVNVGKIIDHAKNPELWTEGDTAFKFLIKK